MTDPAVAIVGMSLASPIGCSLSEFRRALKLGRCGVTLAAPPEEVGDVGFLPCHGAVPEPWHLSEGALRFPATRQLRLARWGLQELEESVRAAVREVGPRRVGLVLGTSTGGVLASEQALPQIHRTGLLPPGYSFRDGQAFDAVARALAEQLSIEGPISVVSTACASAAKAIASARRWIQAGVSEVVLAGGVDSLCRLTLTGFASLSIAAPELARPFDPSSLGMNVSEGATWLLLRRGSGIAIAGVGETNDAYHMTAPDPDGAGALGAMRAALEEAGLEPEKLDYVNAHGTGTRANDQSEARALVALGGSPRVNSTKALLGHQLGTAGATEAVVTALCLRGAELKSSAEFDRSLFTRDGEVPRWPPRWALSNSFAFGGTNVSLLLGRAEEVPSTPRSASPARPVFVERAALWTSEYPTLAALLTGVPQPEPVPRAQLLPERARGRASLLTRIFSEVLDQLGLDGEQLARVPLFFGSAYGQMTTTLELIELHAAGKTSPLKFQTSVHNAPAGLLSIALRNQSFSTSIAAGDETVSATLLEALVYLRVHPELDSAVVLLADEAAPRPLLDEDYPPLGVALLLGREANAGAGLRLEFPEPYTGPEKDSELPAHWTRYLDNPCGGALELVHAVGRGTAGVVELTTGAARRRGGRGTRGELKR